MEDLFPSSRLLFSLLSRPFASTVRCLHSIGLAALSHIHERSVPIFVASSSLVKFGGSETELWFSGLLVFRMYSNAELGAWPRLKTTGQDMM